MKHLMTLIIVFFLFSCSQTFQIMQHKAEFSNGENTIYTSKILVVERTTTDFVNLSLQFGYTYTDTTSYHFFGFTHIGRYWSFLNSISLSVDNKSYELTAAKEPIRKSLPDAFLTEYLEITIPRAIIEEIKNAKIINIKIKGEKNEIGFSFTDETKNNFKRFLSSVKFVNK